MIEKDCVITPKEKEALKLLEEFLPDKIFDAHIHTGKASFNPVLFALGSCFEYATIDNFIEDTDKLFEKDIKFTGNAIICPDAVMCKDKALYEESVNFLVSDLEKHPEFVGEIPVLADDTREDIEKMLVHPQIRGLKCYHVTAKKDVTWNCGIGEYLPEAAWEIANERGMCITLHMVKDAALADSENIDYICEMSDKYPNAKLILAHAARSFAAWTIEKNIERLANRENVYFDFSAICEPTSFMEIIKTCGHKRVLWGSDYPITLVRGKCISIGSSFLWLYREQLEKCASKTNFDAYSIFIENLMAVRKACKLLELDKKAVEDIARDLLILYAGRKIAEGFAFEPDTIWQYEI